MILGYALHGHGKTTLLLFDEMQQAGMNPNHIIFWVFYLVVVILD